MASRALPVVAVIGAGLAGALLATDAAVAGTAPDPDAIEGTYPLQVTPVDPSLPTCTGVGGQAQMEISSATAPGAAAGSFEAVWTFGGEDLTLTGTWNADGTFQIPIVNPAWDPVDPMAAASGTFTASGDTVQVQGRTDPDPMVPEWMNPCPVTWTGQNTASTAGGGPGESGEPGGAWGGRAVEGALVLAAIVTGGLLLRKAVRAGRGPTAGPAAPVSAPAPPLPPGMPPTDAWGRPWIVNNGTYAGGTPGQIWYGGTWVDPAEAVERVEAEAKAGAVEAARREAWRRETQRKSDEWLRSRAGGEETPREKAERREREKLEQELKASEAAVAAARREHRESLAETTRAWEAHARTQERLQKLMGRGESVAEWTQWGAERGIDVLATVTGPTGRSVKLHYQWVKNVSVGAVGAAVTGDGTELLKGVGRAGEDVLWTMHGPKLLETLSGAAPAVLPSGTVTGAALRQAATGYAWSKAVGDPLKNLVEGEAVFRGRDPLTRTLVDPLARRVTEQAATNLAPGG